MNTWMPCGYAVGLMVVSAALALVVGYGLGRWREQLALLETLRPEH